MVNINRNFYEISDRVPVVSVIKLKNASDY